MQRTASALALAEQGEHPLDVETMRATVRLVLAEAPQMTADLATLRLRLRGHMNLLIPAVEALTRKLPPEDIPRACATACIGEARMRLRLGGGDNDRVRLAVTVKLARSVDALADHYETLGRQS
ncbi:DUF6415 family natural product biosynthesis protein [Streptomyces sp. NPDC085995]|uniref:DUF6415 family natural product biosynthesis protein n=1 Tax=Streptomyces sp. NPDC085995 TaxID=3154861 RepID=UPI003434CE62